MFDGIADSELVIMFREAMQKAALASVGAALASRNLTIGRLRDDIARLRRENEILTDELKTIRT